MQARLGEVEEREEEGERRQSTRAACLHLTLNPRAAVCLYPHQLLVVLFTRAARDGLAAPPSTFHLAPPPHWRHGANGAALVFRTCPLLSDITLLAHFPHCVPPPPPPTSPPSPPSGCELLRPAAVATRSQDPAPAPPRPASHPRQPDHSSSAASSFILWPSVSASACHRTLPIFARRLLQLLLHPLILPRLESSRRPPKTAWG